MGKEVLNPEHWERQYEEGDLPWETGRPSTELQHVVSEQHIEPCRALEIGCGTGSSAIWLAHRGFEVTALDLSSLALQQARQRAADDEARVDFQVADLTKPLPFRDEFDFFFDGGCYHAVRLADGPAYFRTLVQITRPHAYGLVLLGNAAEPEDEVGPPTLEEWQVRGEWGEHFNILQLRPFRFDRQYRGAKRYLGWSCFVQKKDE
jgi:SAM-dependent methyltransferase